MRNTLIALLVIAICIVGGSYLFRNQVHQYAGEAVTKHILTHPQVQTAINESVSKYIISHPQVVEQSVINLQAQKQKEEHEKTAKLVQHYGQDLMNDKDGSPILGNPNGSVKMVVFMDPFCGYCRRFHEVLSKAVEENKDLEIIIREIPIISDKSDMAIRAELAAKMQGKYVDFQKAMYKADPSVSHNELLAIAKNMSADPTRMAQDMERPEFKKLIERNMHLAQQIHLTGTPTYIINGHVMSGAISYTQLQELLDKGNKKRKAPDDDQGDSNKQPKTSEASATQ
jgi:protein-disulfide isomerase